MGDLEPSLSGFGRLFLGDLDGDLGNPRALDSSAESFRLRDRGVLSRFLLWRSGESLRGSWCMAAASGFAFSVTFDFQSVLFVPLQSLAMWGPRHVEH